MNKIISIFIGMLLYFFFTVHANARSIVTPTHMKYTHWRLKVSDFFRAAIVRPFALIIGYEFFFHSAALSGFRPYMIEAFSALDMPVRPEWLAVS